jgi:hypothetical protein
MLFFSRLAVFPQPVCTGWLHVDARNIVIQMVPGTMYSYTCIEVLTLYSTFMVNFEWYNL